MVIGEKIKQLRLQHGLTQEELADRCELSKGFISLVERDLTSPSVATLTDMLECLGTDLRAFFSEKSDEKLVFGTEDTAVKVDPDGLKGFIRYLVPNAQKNAMEPILVEMAAGGETIEDDPHAGEEFGYVLSGAVEIHIGKRVVRARKDESFYFTPDGPHKLINPGRTVARLIWVSTPPNFKQRKGMGHMEETRLIELKGISKDFGGTIALSDVNLYILKREFITLLGPSGCGKTTLLRIIGGFETAFDGELFFEGKEISALPPHKRRVNTVFQKYALFPHLNVFDNIAFGLKLKKMAKPEIERRVGRMLELVAMKGYEKRSVESLSGGQQQRIAIARALVNEPEVLLLDEPLGALDLKLRKEMQLELKTMQQELGITFVYVTHDQEEALTMSDTIVVMKDGRIQQIGDPKRIYDEPENAFVADFIGESNILSGVMIEDELVRAADYDFECVDSGFGEMTPVDVVVRPEDIMVVGEDVGMLVGDVESVLFKGVHYEMMVNTGSFTWKVHSTTMQSAGSRVGLSIVPFNIHIMRKEAAQ